MTSPAAPTSPNAPSPEGDREASSAPRRRQAESERRRRRILDAARDCLGELGYAGATVTEIARRADVSNGLLYQFFRNKEALFERVLEEILRDWVRAMLPRPDESALESLEGMFRRSVAFCRTHPLLPAFLRADPELQLFRLEQTGRDRIQPHRDLVARLLEQGIARRELRSDLDVAATADVICQLQSDYSSRACRNDPRFPDDPRVIDAAVELIHARVRADSI
jgi:AcrR family transcriptional regulator